MQILTKWEGREMLERWLEVCESNTAGRFITSWRGNRREAIFLDDEERRFFLQALSEACEKTGWRVHAWVLMGNHYHLFIETPEAKALSAGVSR